MTVHPEPAIDRSALRAELERSRARSLALTDLPDAELCRQVDPLMSPLVWDLAHVGNYEEQWLLRAVDGREPIDATLDGLYDAFEHPRAERPSLPILGPDQARRYIGRVRAQVLELLERVDPDPADPLLAGGFVWAMVAQHEHQHCETMLATHQLRGERAVAPAPAPGPDAATRPDGMVAVPAGTFTMGSRHPWALDNERPAHQVELDAFEIDVTPVTNDRYVEFIADGGYDRPDLWTEAGWKWRVEADLTAPLFWRRARSGWEVLRFGSWTPLRAGEPVQHVCWYEADAYARWAGKRLPTEAEWERAAAGADIRHANLGQRHTGPAEIGAYPDGASDVGCHQMLGDVWEWTATDFAGYPGFEAFPYREYSEVFFDDGYKVLRGGSWAADPLAVRTTFRNWDFPIRRQIFCGFRCARSS